MCPFGGAALRRGVTTRRYGAARNYVTALRRGAPARQNMRVLERLGGDLSKFHNIWIKININALKNGGVTGA